MNNRTTYELSIAEKLEHMQVPDMQDAIWSRIEAQLDIDMPTDTNHTGENPDSDWWNLFGNAGPFVVIVAIVTVLFFQTHKKNNPLPLQKENTNQVQEKTINNKTGNSPPGSILLPEDKPGIKNNSADFSGKEILPGYDSITSTVVDPLVIPEASIETPASVLPHALTNPANDEPAKTLLSDPPAKKPRGVQGIKEGDYRLVPKPDSTKPIKN